MSLGGEFGEVVDLAGPGPGTRRERDVEELWLGA
jgi:hypothetical protein